MFSYRVRGWCGVFVIMLLVGPAAATPILPSFHGLGDLPGGDMESRAYGVGVDANGDPVVCGWSESSLEREAFRWTEAGGMVGLGALSVPPMAWSFAGGISADASTIVGTSSTTEPYEMPFRWSIPDGMAGMGYVPGGSYMGSAYDTNADGSVIVGYSSSPGGVEAFRWTEGGGMMGLGDLPGGYISSSAYGVSADGSVVVGDGQTDYGYEAWRWTEAGGMEPLFTPPDPPNGEPLAVANAVSADGSVIVGQYHVSPPYTFQGYRWTEDGGLNVLDDPVSGLRFNKVFDVSDDGSVIVGEGLAPQEALIWIEGRGILRIQDLLTDQLGLDLGGWNLQSAQSISADGTVIAGYGSAGGTQAWMAVIPEPTTGCIALVFGVAVCLRRRNDVR